MIEAALATQLAGLLAPFLPKLMDTTASVGKKAVESVGGRVGEVAWNEAVKVWNILRPEVETKPEVAKAIKDVAQNADDPDAKVALTWQLKKLTLPPATLDELQKIITESKSEVRITTATSGGVAIGGSSSGNTITTNFQGPEKNV